MTKVDERRKDYSKKFLVKNTIKTCFCGIFGIPSTNQIVLATEMTSSIKVLHNNIYYLLDQ